MRNWLRHWTLLPIYVASCANARADAERVRRAAEVRERRESASACGAERAAVSACEGLLRESVGLLAEGRGLLQETAGVHDAAIGVK